MSFEELRSILPLSQIETGTAIRIPDQCLLAERARYGDSGCSPILIYACLSNDAFYVITILDGGRKCLQHNGSDTFTPAIACEASTQ
jgi:hypothetical protein